MVAHKSNPSSREAEAEESNAGLQTAWSIQQVTSQAELYSQDGLKRAKTETKRGCTITRVLAALHIMPSFNLKKICSILGRIKETELASERDLDVIQMWQLL